MGYFRVIRNGLSFLLFLLSYCCFAQDSVYFDKASSYPDKVFVALDKKTASIQSKLDHSLDKYLSKLQKQENKLKKKLLKKDSILAHQLFDGVVDKYNGLKAKTGQLNKYESVYSGHLDSLTTALSFLKNNPLSSLTNHQELQRTLDQYKGLQDKLNATEQIQKFLANRQELLKQQFEKLGMIREFKRFQKQVYYYQAQVQEIKQAIEDPSKLEQKLMELMVKVPQFKEFFAKNSMLGSLFALPGSGSASTASLQGLQTREMINQSLVDRFGAGGDVTQHLQKNLQNAQEQLNDLKGKLGQYASGGYGNSSSDMSMPDFKPNQEKTHSFLKRLTYGFNIQSHKARYMFPVTTELALSIGYKPHQNNEIGLGVSAKVGLGSGWSHIAVSYQGIGLRSYISIKLKGSLWASGGYEMNYLKLIYSTAQLKDYSAWQKSGLIGLSKKYTISKKLKGDLKLLWDFLSYQQMPRTNPILFRFGYSLK